MTLASLLWWLVIGALFYWMMKKGGCGMHGGHSGGDREHNHAGVQAPKLRDPVCGMEVDPETAAGIRVIQGRNAFLCSDTCLEKFDNDPTEYEAQFRAAQGEK